MPGPPGQAAVLQSPPVLVEVFLLRPVSVHEPVVSECLGEEEGPRLTPNPRHACTESSCEDAHCSLVYKEKNGKLYKGQLRGDWLKN